MIKPDMISYAIGLVGVGFAIFFGIKQHNAKKVMRVFVRSIQNQAQSVCGSLQDVINRQGSNFDWLKGKIEGAFDNMAALNGTIIDFCNEFYKKKTKKANNQC